MSATSKCSLQIVASLIGKSFHLMLSHLILAIIPVPIGLPDPARIVDSPLLFSLSLSDLGTNHDPSFQAGLSCAKAIYGILIPTLDSNKNSSLLPATWRCCFVYNSIC